MSLVRVCPASYFRECQYACVSSAKEAHVKIQLDPIFNYDY
jgi:hypothetical protein